MRHTLKEFLKFYNKIDRIQLVIAEHSVVIDCDREGSFFIVSAFLDKKFRLISYDDGLLILNSNLYE